MICDVSTCVYVYVWRRRTAKRVAPAPAAAFAALDPVIEYAASSPAVTSVTHHVASSPAAAYAAPTPLSQLVAPTPAPSGAADLSRMNKEQLIEAAAAAAASMTAALAEAEAAMKVDATLADPAAAASMTAALAEAEAAQRKMLKVVTTFADLAAEALLQEEGEEQAQAALTDGSSGTRGYRCSYRLHA